MENAFRNILVIHQEYISYVTVLIPETEKEIRYYLLNFIVLLIVSLP